MDAALPRFPIRPVAAGAVDVMPEGRRGSDRPDEPAARAGPACVTESRWTCGPTEAESGAGRENLLMSETTAMRRRREIEFLAHELFRQAQDLVTAVGDLIPAELATGGGELVEGTPLRAVAQQLDDSRCCASTCCSRSSACRTGAEPAVRAAARREPRRRAGPEMSSRIAGPTDPQWPPRGARWRGNRWSEACVRACRRADQAIPRPAVGTVARGHGRDQEPRSAHRSPIPGIRPPGPEPAGNVRSPKVGQRYHDLVKEARRDRVGLARSRAPRIGSPSDLRPTTARGSLSGPNHPVASCSPAG